MKFVRKKILIIPLGIIFSIILIVFLFNYAINVYTDYRMQRLPHMRVILEVDITQFLESLAKDRDETFYSIMEEVKKELKINQKQNVFYLIQNKFIEKQISMSKYYGSVKENDDNIIDSLMSITKKALDGDGEVIRNRLDQYGIYKPLIQKKNDWQLVVEFPLESKNREEEVKQLLQGYALLEFRLVKDPELTINIMQKIDNILAGTTNRNLNSTSTTRNVIKEMTEDEFAKIHPFFSVALLNPQSTTADAYIREGDREKIDVILSKPDVQNVIPIDAEFVFSAKPITQLEGKDIYVLYFVSKNPELTGRVIKDVSANVDPNTSSPIINIEMNIEGAKEWSRITGNNIGKRIAIMLDGIVYTAPIVKSKITGGRSQLEGMENLKEAKLIEIVLKAGALPAPLNIISQEFIEVKN